MARVPASERTRNALKDMLAGKSATDKSSLLRQAARLIVEEALEGEAADALGGRGCQGAFKFPQLWSLKIPHPG